MPQLHRNRWLPSPPLPLPEEPESHFALSTTDSVATRRGPSHVTQRCDPESGFATVQASLKAQQR